MFVGAAGRTAIARSIESESSSRRVLSATRSPGESGGRGPQVLRPEVAADEAATTQTPPTNYAGSCAQREPKKPKASYAKSANLRGIVCGPLAAAAI